MFGYYLEASELILKRTMRNIMKKPHVKKSSDVSVLLSAVNFQMQAISARLLGIQTQRAVSAPAGKRYHWSDRCSDSGAILSLFLYIQSTIFSQPYFTKDMIDWVG